MNHHVIADAPGTWHDGWVRGSLTHVGWGSAHGSPALKHAKTSVIEGGESVSWTVGRSSESHPGDVGREDDCNNLIDSLV